MRSGMHIVIQNSKEKLQLREATMFAATRALDEILKNGQ